MCTSRTKGCWVTEQSIYSASSRTRTIVHLIVRYKSRACATQPLGNGSTSTHSMHGSAIVVIFTVIDANNLCAHPFVDVSGDDG